MGNLLLKLRGPQDDDPQIFIDFEKRELQQKAWADVCPLVARLKRYFEYSQKIEKALRPLLQELCTDVDMKPAEHLDSHQALAKQFAKILHFTLKFDDLKSGVPAGSSYIMKEQPAFLPWAQTILAPDCCLCLALPQANSVWHTNPQCLTLTKAEPHLCRQQRDGQQNVPVLAEACPMLKVLSDSTTKFRALLKIPNEDTSLFCMRIMVGLIILYDHVHPVGAFDKKSSIDVKSCIKVLKDQNPNEFENLMNALRYNSKHFNDESTPYSTRALLT
ncbi:protein FAM49B-like [Strongylocentrotus purpuratus]|uniref:CYRIA/CYRIB Rac1 binding domain-containing protein n=1 Tax=Strongylocentrotus purpuratus TaxID=7668 RepID=A0A7M7NIT1_STRPU|nr:protein FAM49B-like [Strongylocentrotus purpuratus]